MAIKVKFFARLAEIVGAREIELEPGRLGAGRLTLDQLFALCAERYPDLAHYRNRLLYALNGEYASPEAEVGHDDEVAFLPPVSGG